MILILAFIFCGNYSEDYKKNYSDDRTEIQDYSDVVLLLTLQHLQGYNDTKDIVDLIRIKSLKETIKAFYIMFRKELCERKEIYKAFFDNDGQVDPAIQKCSFFVLNEIINLLCEQNNYKIKHKCNFRIAIRNFRNNYFQKETDILKPEKITEICKKRSKDKNHKLRTMINEVDKIWTLLYKKIPKNDILHKSNIIITKNAFMTPGGRFRELYYWDSYWIFSGQLSLGLNSIVLEGIDNFVDLLERFGFIPNGTRAYYTKRTQPPYFTQMIFDYFSTKGGLSDIEKKYIQAMFKEYNFWKTKRSIIIKHCNKKHFLNRYDVSSNYPRPEAMREDIETFKKYLLHLNKYEIIKRDIRNYFYDYVKKPFLYEDAENDLYSHIKSAAESGWDFSTRFFDNYTNLYTICTREIIPVDLNALLYSNEVIIGKILKSAKDYDKSKEFEQASRNRKYSINELFWKDGCWRDYHIKNKTHRTGFFYFSNLMPMIYGIDPPEGNVYDIMYKYKEILFSYKGGIPASDNLKSTEQWDFPNAWPPHQHLFVMFLLGIKEEEMARHTAASFYRSVQACNKNGKFYFYEKYKCNELGKPGDKGEYITENQFGWTAGVIAKFIHIFGEKIIISEKEHEQNYEKIISMLKEKSSLRKNLNNK